MNQGGQQGAQTRTLPGNGQAATGTAGQDKTDQGANQTAGGDQNNAQSKKRQQAGASQQGEDTQTTGEAQNQTTKKRQGDANQQATGGATDDQATEGNQQATGGNEQGQTRKKNQQARQNNNNEPATTGSVEINDEQRTTIKQTIIKHSPRPVEHVDFDINIGVTIPHTVELHTLPPEIVEIVPAYRHYEYFVLADGTIVIVDPNAWRIVYVIA